MLRVLVVLSALCGALVTADGFAKKYGYSKVMANCFGEDLYYSWSKEVFKAVKECYGEEMKLPKAHEKESSQEEEDNMDPTNIWNRFDGQPVYLYYPPQAQGQAQNFPFNFPYQVISLRMKKREAPLYTAPIIKKMVHKVKAKVSNFTCVMRKMNYIDDDFNLNYDAVNSVKELDISEELKEDLVKGMEKCKELTMCLPLEKSGSPMPLKLQRMVALNKCWKKARFGVCMKHDFMKYLDEFDLPGDEDSDEGSKAEKIIHILMGVEERDDFQLY
ncbi:uncharacterized protein LOC119582182 [Penaeus monodon]|uniref:uncharacterized protein LOC119582182 n=1 Tax=Penaeus monodon TaxID=6687 RepID=UPI0018A7DE21|nr:uncharacterized protein LOC119582182 [Penaeus monodon]